MAKIKTHGEKEEDEWRADLYFLTIQRRQANHYRKKTSSNSCCKAKRRKRIEKLHFIEQAETVPHDSSSSESTDISDISTRIIVEGYRRFIPRTKEEYLFERKIVFYAAFDIIP